MSDTEIVGGAEEVTALDTTHWPTQRQAIAEYGFTQQKLSQLVSGGKVSTVLVAGSRRYCPDDLDALKVSQDSATTVAGEVVAMLKQAQGHQERTLTQAIGPLEVLTKAYASELERLSKRCAYLEERHDELLKAKETFISDQHVRDMEIRDFEAKRERKSKSLGVITGAVAQLMPQIQETIGLAGSKKAKAALELLESFKGDETVSALLATDFLNERQKQLLQLVIAEENAPAPAIVAVPAGVLDGTADPLDCGPQPAQAAE